MNQHQINNQERSYDVFWNFLLEVQPSVEGLYRIGDFDTAVETISQVFNLVVPELDFEFGLHEDGYFEFIIIAGGISENISLVLDMYHTAPQVDGWVIVPFRPRQECETFNMPDRDYHRDDFYYKSEVCDQGITHLNIYIKGYVADKEQEFGSIAFMFLDTVLGEYGVMTQIGGVEICLYPNNADSMGLKPIYELRQEMDQRYPPNA